MTYIRKVKVGNHTYLAEVKSVREGKKVRQQFIRYLGRNVDGSAVRMTSTDAISLEGVKRSLDVLAVDKIARMLELPDLLEDNRVLSLVYSQLLCRKPISKLEEWFTHTEIPDVLDVTLSTKQLYHALADLADFPFVRLEGTLSHLLEKYEKSCKAAVIDVTDTYFEGKRRAGTPRRGKDGKVRRLLQIGLAVTLRHGFPLFHRTYHGNLSNMMIFKDMITRLKERRMHPIIMDRGMHSTENLDILLSLQVPVIAGLRKTPTLESTYLKRIKRERIFTLKNRVKLKKTSVFTKSYTYRKGKLIVVYNPSSEIVKKELNFERGVEGDSSIGYSLIYHNTHLTDHEAVKKYYDKDTIERAFKQLKGVLNVRPVRVWLKNHVEGHVKVCYLAYAILSLINYKLRRQKISAVDALESLQHGYRVTLKDEKNKHQWNLTVPLEPHQKNILKALGVVTKT